MVTAVSIAAREQGPNGITQKLQPYGKRGRALKKGTSLALGKSHNGLQMQGNGLIQRVKNFLKRAALNGNIQI